MPQKFLVEMHDGKKFVVEADSQPTEEEVMAHLGGQTNAPEGKSIPGFIGNTIASAGNLVGNAGKALVNVLNPNPDQNTVVGLGRTAMGVAQSALPANAVEGAAKAGIPDERRYADAAKNYVGSRYGSLKNIGDTLYNDPVGALADVSGLLTGTGEALDLGNVLAKSSTLGKVADAAKVAGTVTDPLKAMGSAVNTGLKVPSKFAERVIASNVKIPDSLKLKNPTKNIPRIILDSKYSPGAKGAEQANRIIESLGNDITAKVNTPGHISASPLTAGPMTFQPTYHLQPLINALDALEQEYLHQPNATADVAAVRAAKDSLMNNPLYSEDKFGPDRQVVGRQLIPQTAPEIDRMKKNVYAGLLGKYGKEGNAAIEVDKTEGRALKGILNDNIDGVKDLNAKQSDAIVARNALAAMGRREQNKYPLGLMDLAAAGVGTAGVAAGLSGVAPLALTAAILKHPTTAFPIARGLDKMRPITLPNFTKPLTTNLTPITQLSRATANAKGNQPGNINLKAQPEVKNPDGSVSTVDSRSFNIDGQEVLLPSVTPDGRHLKTDQEILQEYKKTGRFLGKFKSIAEANAYAEQLHNDYAAGKYR